MSEKVFVTCALTGSSPLPAPSDFRNHACVLDHAAHSRAHRIKIDGERSDPQTYAVFIRPECKIRPAGRDVASSGETRKMLGLAD